MSWIKKGVIFKTDNNFDWMCTHACVPTVYQLDEDTLRIFFAPRNSLGQSIPTFIDVNADDPNDVKYLHDKPIMSLGALGTFDDGGIMPCCIIKNEGLLFLYYVGWNPSVSVPYRNAVGLAISDDEGKNFHRKFPGSIVDRNQQEPFFTASPWVMKEHEKWHMWYASSTGFKIIKGKPEPLYIIKYAHSVDGINWNRQNITCIEPKSEDEANARATVIKENKTYKMWYAYRGSYDFRDGSDAYQIGYAESKDALNWKRKDYDAGIKYSKQGWDSKMQTYPCVINVKGKKLLFYNGNSFGKTGIGYAIWKD